MALLGCLSGATDPSSGEIILNGECFNRLTPRLAIRKGVAIIYQHFQVIEGLSVADNGSEIRKWGVIGRCTQFEQARKLLTRLSSSIDPSLPLEN